MLRETLLGTTLASLAACSSPNVKAPLTPRSSTVEIETGPFVPLINHDLLSDGRPKEMYALIYADDLNVCSKLTQALNETRKPQMYTDSNLLSAIDTILGTNYSVDWINLNTPSSPYSYTEADIDHDGIVENLTRQTEHLGSNITQTLKILPYRYIRNDDETATEAREKFDGKDAGREFIIPQSFDNLTIDFGDSLSVAPRGERDFGEFIEIAQIDSLAYILLGGITRGSRINKDAETPVRVLKKNLVNPHSKFEYTLVCELRPQFRQAVR